MTRELAQAFVDGIRARRPEWNDVAEVSTEVGLSIEIRIPCPNPKVGQPLRIVVEIDETDDLDCEIGWADGHHEHFLQHDYESLDLLVDGVVAGVDEWVNPDNVCISLRQDGKLKAQWVDSAVRWRDAFRQGGLLEPLSDAFPERPMPGETMYMISWTGEHDRIVEG